MRLQFGLSNSVLILAHGAHFLHFTGKADEIDCTYVNDGLPTDVNEYIKSKQGFGKSFVDFFSDGGLIKFNPFK